MTVMCLQQARGHECALDVTTREASHLETFIEAIASSPSPIASLALGGLARGQSNGYHRARLTQAFTLLAVSKKPLKHLHLRCLGRLTGSDLAILGSSALPDHHCLSTGPRSSSDPLSEQWRSIHRPVSQPGRQGCGGSAPGQRLCMSSIASGLISFSLVDCPLVRVPHWSS
jgi:hypothetical protein